MLDSLSIEVLEFLRWIAFSLFIASAIGVTLGVYWENENNKESLRHRGWLLLVWSLGVEIVLTIGIFVIDGTISTRQRSEIIALERAIAPRILENLKPIGALKAFNGISVFLNADRAIDGFGNQLEVLFGVIGWKVTRFSDKWPAEAVEIEYVSSPMPGQKSRSEQAAAALICQLQKQDINVQWDRLSPDVLEKMNSWPKMASAEAIVIRVGPKPNWFWAARKSPQFREIIEQLYPKFDCP